MAVDPNQSIIYGRHPSGSNYKVLVDKNPITIKFTAIVWPKGWEASFIPEEPKEPARKVDARLHRRIQSYLDSIPGAISGQGGHNQTIKAATALTYGFALSEAEASPYLDSYNLRCEPPWSEKGLRHKLSESLKFTSDKPRGSLINETAENGETNETETVGPLISFLRPSEILAYEPPEGHLLVGDNHIVKGGVFVIGGAPGIGKSRSAMALAVAGARGLDWLGYPVHRQFRTMILQNENGQHRLKSELSDIDVDLDEWVRISPPPPLGMQWARKEFREQLRLAIEDFLPDVFIIDPWNATARDHTQKDYLEAFELVQSVLPTGDDKPALGIVAHTRKPKSEERHSGRALLNLLSGSYVLGSVPRCAWVMQAASDDTEDGRILWTCCKNNDGEMGPRSAWIRQNGLFTPIEDFEWEDFDSNGTGNKLSWEDLPAMLKERFGSGIHLRKTVVDFLVKEKGRTQPTAYRWIDNAVKDGILDQKKDYISI
jgi:hypothetical protein